MDFKNMTSDNSYKALYGISIILWIVAALFVTALWNRYSSNSTSTARNQLEVLNNYLLSIEPTDKVAIERAVNALPMSSDTPIDRIFLTIYDKNGTPLYSNATSSRNENILSFNKMKNKFKNDTAQQKVLSYTNYDAILQKQCVIVSTYSDKFGKYVISESTINDNTNIMEFLSTMSFKLLLLFVLTMIATSCIHMLYKHINNIARLRKYITQLSEDEDFLKHKANKITQQNNVKSITEDLYTLYRTKIDIIKQHDLEREQAIHEEKTKLYSKRILANNLNHEIKTPIGIIIGYLDTLINHPDIDTNTRLDFLKKCLQNTQRLQNMVVNIAVINRLEDGSNTIALEDVNIHDITNQAKEDLKFTLSEYNMTFRNETNPDSYVRANEMLLYNVLCNLIKNSCFYSGGTEIIFKEESRNQEFITYIFSDNGKGVPENAIPKLFDRFYRLEKDKNSKSGTGLGLPIVKEAIILCGGTIDVISSPDSGLTFKFTIPATD